ncbi:GNAT family N-acetyltransferase [Paenibacillus sp. GSMTC-2017]|uniref:GNAT family N-acetyltransferase n=1 Tax=Paenibacillus sp. GSMTC-2017 TaxID=2794350 RepID=UPI0018D8B73E|nr:GNAT family N-acetyltransferase [Paenibacillus sp. GSMTC-2017]MBH5318172.1 GNAT family N-acetyltransferase [Paenibacillus sp. GSMTC-2017]
MDNKKHIEEMSLNGWPALQTVLYDGWLLRFANGYTKRSNSISAIYGHTLPLTDKIKRCEEIYSKRNLPTIFKITPFSEPSDLDDRLDALGYEMIDHTSVKTASLRDLVGPTNTDTESEAQVGEKKTSTIKIIITTDPTSFWLDAVATMQGLNDDQRETTRRMMSEQPLRKAFAVLLEGRKPVACGAIVLEQGFAGLYDIVTDVASRGKGYGEQLTRQLLVWAKENGAENAYLLVVTGNVAANRLYDKFGFKHSYDYWYRVKKLTE